MIELLGVGAPREDGGWLLHRVCARTPCGQSFEHSPTATAWPLS